MRKPIQIIVGNIGVVYSGDNEEKAKQTFEEYKDQSEKNYGRAAGEDVTWFENGEIVESFYGSLNKE